MGLVFTFIFGIAEWIAQAIAGWSFWNLILSYIVPENEALRRVIGNPRFAALLLIIVALYRPGKEFFHNFISRYIIAAQMRNLSEYSIYAFIHSLFENKFAGLSPYHVFAFVFISLLTVSGIFAFYAELSAIINFQQGGWATFLIVSSVYLIQYFWRNLYVSWFVAGKQPIPDTPGIVEVEHGLFCLIVNQARKKRWEIMDANIPAHTETFFKTSGQRVYVFLKGLTHTFEQIKEKSIYKISIRVRIQVTRNPRELDLEDEDLTEPDATTMYSQYRHLSTYSTGKLLLKSEDMAEELVDQLSLQQEIIEVFIDFISSHKRVVGRGQITEEDYLNFLLFMLKLKTDLHSLRDKINCSVNKRIKYVFGKLYSVKIRVIKVFYNEMFQDPMSGELHSLREIVEFYQSRLNMLDQSRLLELANNQRLKEELIKQIEGLFLEFQDPQRFAQFFRDLTGPDLPTLPPSPYYEMQDIPEAPRLWSEQPSELPWEDINEEDDKGSDDTR